MSPCCTSFSAELSLGNINTSTLYQLWNSDAMKNLRKIHKAGDYTKNEWCEKCVNGMCGKPITNELLDIKKISAPKWK